MDSPFFSPFSNTTSVYTPQPEEKAPPGLFDGSQPLNPNDGYYPFNTSGSMPYHDAPAQLYPMKDYWNSPSYPIDSFAPLSQPFNRPPSSCLSSSISEAQRDYSSHSFMELSSPSFFNTDSFVSASSRTADPSSTSFSSSRENTNDVTNGFSQSQVLSNSTSSPLKLSSSIPAPSFFPHQVSALSTSARPEAENSEVVPHATASLRQYAAVREFVPTPSSSTPTSSTELSHEPPPEPAATVQSTNYEYVSHRKGVSNGERASSNNAGTKRGRRQNGRVDGDDME